MDKATFIATLAPHAIQARRDGSPMFPSVRLAQNLLETGGVIHSWFNLGGIKVGNGKPNQWWDGSSVNKKTWEVYGGQRVNTSANFRAYSSTYNFYRDQDRLFEGPRYTRVRAAPTPEEQAYALKECGYATDPEYPSKLISLIVKHGLKQYDAVPIAAEEDEDEMKLSDYQWTMLANALDQQKVEKQWVEKAKKKTLTLSELTWLNTITSVRK